MVGVQGSSATAAAAAETKTPSTLSKNNVDEILRAISYFRCDSLPADDGDDDGEAYGDVLPHSRRVIDVGLQPVHPARQKKILAELQPVEDHVAGKVRNLPALPQ